MKNRNKKPVKPKGPKQVQKKSTNANPTSSSVAVTDASHLDAPQQHVQAYEEQEQQHEPQHVHSSVHSSPMVVDEDEFQIGGKAMTPYISELFGKLKKATEAANNLPMPDQHKYLSTYSTKYAQAMKQSSKNILKYALVGFLHIFSHSTISSIQSMQKGTTDGPISELDDTTEQYDSTVDLLDQLLENIV